MLNMISFLGAQFLSISRGYKKKTDKKFILAQIYRSIIYQGEVTDHNKHLLPTERKR